VGNVTGGPVDVQVHQSGPGRGRVLTAANITADCTTTATDLVLKKANGNTNCAWRAPGNR